MGWDLTRGQWGAGPHRAGAIRLPVVKLILHNTVTPFWTGSAAARNLQRIARERGFLDTSYSGLATRADELIEGRGWGRQGAHTAGHNTTGHALSLVGNLDVNAVPDGMIRATVRGVRDHRRVGPGRITHGHRDLGSTACPGRYAYGRIPAINAAASGTPSPPRSWFDMASKADLRAEIRAENERQTKAIAWEVLKGLIWQSNEAPVKVDGLESAAQEQLGWVMHATLRDAISVGGHSREALEELVESVVRRVLDERA